MREAAYEIVRRFGYLQLDTVSVAGARSHAIVLHSRLPGLSPDVPESLLRPRAPLFEYWGHEASWIPIELYPAFGFRRRAFRKHPWWGDLIEDHPRIASSIVDRVRGEGPLRSADIESRKSSGWWDLSVAKKVVSALWSAGTLAVLERRSFQRTYDLTERVIAARWREKDLDLMGSLKTLLLKALEGHGWASVRTLSATWRFRFLGAEVRRALEELEEEGAISKCVLHSAARSRLAGWIRPEDLELSARLLRVHPSPEGGVLLSPFDPLLWDRGRVDALFGFHQILEVFTPASRRKYGYYCMPVLAGERLVARCDVKADRAKGVLRTISVHYERGVSSADRSAVRSALMRFADTIALSLERPREVANARRA
jgi:hypothetical protein